MLRTFLGRARYNLRFAKLVAKRRSKKSLLQRFFCYFFKSLWTIIIHRTDAKEPQLELFYAHFWW